MWQDSVQPIPSSTAGTGEESEPRLPNPGSGSPCPNNAHTNPSCSWEEREASSTLELGLPVYWKEEIPLLYLSFRSYSCQRMNACVCLFSLLTASWRQGFLLASLTKLLPANTSEALCYSLCCCPVFLRSRCRTEQRLCLTLAHYLRFLKEASKVKQAVHCFVWLYSKNVTAAMKMKSMANTTSTHLWNIRFYSAKNMNISDW